MDQEYLKSILDYCPITGIFIWKYNGEEAGSVYTTGYVRIQHKGKRYFAHRLAFLYMTGKMPKYVDHINGIRDDNSWKNLRTATKIINCQNAAKPKSNTSGCIGVRKRDGMWIAKIGVNNKSIHLGTFLDKRDAIKARKQAERKYGFHPNHGR